MAACIGVVCCAAMHGWLTHRHAHAQVSLPTQYNNRNQDPVGGLSSALARIQSNKPLRELREIAKGMTKQLPDVVQKATAKIDE